MTRHDAHGQPIGVELPGWSVRPLPARTTVVGRYVRLEPVSPDHVPDLFAALCAEADDALWTYRHDDRPQDEAGLTRMVEAWAAREPDVTFAVVPADSGTPAGLATLMRIDPVHGSAEIGAVLHSRSLQRTRAATEAIHLLAGHVLDDLGYRRLEWKLDSLNAPSARAAVRLGFSYEGTFRNAMVYKGRNRDTAWYALTDGDWPGVRAAHRRWLHPANFDGRGQQRTSLSDLTEG